VSISVNRSNEPGVPATRRRESEAALRESEELYRLLAENSTDMISKHTPDGVYLYASPACHALLGYEPEELVGRSAYEFFHPDDLEAIRQTHSTILELPDTYTVSYSTRRKDGSYIRFETTSRTIRDPETGEVREIIAVSRDITARKQAEEDLRKSEREYRDLFELANDAILIYEPESRAILDANDSACKMYGMSRELLVGTTMKELSADRKRARQYLDTLLKEGSYKDFETIHRRADGTLINVIADSSVIEFRGSAAILSIYRDVTDRTRAEAQLRFQAQLLEQVQAAVIATDIRGMVTHWNAYAGKLYGWSPAEVLGRDISELTIGPEETSLAAGIMEQLRAGEPWEGEFVTRRKDGSTFPAYVTDSLIHDAEGRAIGIVGVSTDITERKRLEEAVYEIREAERRRIARDLHDVVLQDLAGALQGMQAARIEARGSGSDIGLDQEIDALRRASEGLRNAVYNLRFKGKQPFVRELESLVELNRQMTPEREISLTVEDDFPQELPERVSVELLRIIQETLVNIRHHSGAHRVETALWMDRGFVQAEVRDNGRGFHPSSLLSGMGISGMRERALALGGVVEVLSEPGKGTSVKVEIPLQ